MKTLAGEMLGLALYILFVQYVLADFVFERPDEAWVRIGWRWLAAQRAAWWDVNVGTTYNQPGAAEEPAP